MRGKDGSGFVEDEQPGVAIEQLENLNPLLHADGQVLHLRIRVDPPDDAVRSSCAAAVQPSAG